MRVILAIFLFVQGWIFAIQTDFDVAVIGTSPVCLLEAVHHIAKQEKVLILEADPRCGGAWKSIDICGIQNVDLGCHLIGSDVRIKDFFEKYFACKFLCLEHPTQDANDGHLRCQNGFYFSKGCDELISRLTSYIAASRNGHLLHKKVESVYFDPGKQYVELYLGDVRYTAAKLYTPSMSSFQVENPTFQNQTYPQHLFNHLYLLIEDPTPSRFTYLNGFVTGMSRAMNLTPFLHFPRPGLQLIVIQTHNANELKEYQKFLDAFKNKGLLSKEARIVDSDTLVYKQTGMNTSALQQVAGGLIEILDTSSFGGMVRYLDRWKSSLTPLR